MMKLLDDVVDVGLERLTKPSEAILARRTTADSTTVGQQRQEGFVSRS